jgi:hypothetical protein
MGMYLEGSCRVVIEVVSRYVLGRTEEYHRKIRIAGVPPGIRNKHLLKKRLELHSCASPLSRNYSKKRINVTAY